MLYLYSQLKILLFEQAFRDNNGSGDAEGANK